MEEKDKKEAIDNTMKILADSLKKHQNDEKNKELLSKAEEIIERRTAKNK